MDDRTDELHEAISRSGYYPEIVSRGVRDALGGETARGFVLQHEPTFDGDQIRRHITVLVLTASRILVVHTDEHPAEGGALAYTTTSTEAVSLAAVRSVVVTRVVPTERADLEEAILAISWGSVSRIDLEPARCPDPDCDADHGYTGLVNAEDFTITFTGAGDGADAVNRMLSFAQQLSAATASGFSAGRL